MASARVRWLLIGVSVGQARRLLLLFGIPSGVQFHVNQESNRTKGHYKDDDLGRIHSSPRVVILSTGLSPCLGKARCGRRSAVSCAAAGGVEETRQMRFALYREGKRVSRLRNRNCVERAGESKCIGAVEESGTLYANRRCNGKVTPGGDHGRLRRRLEGRTCRCGDSGRCESQGKQECEQGALARMNHSPLYQRGMRENLALRRSHPAISVACERSALH